MARIPAQPPTLPIAKSRLITLICFLLLLYVVVPRIGNFSKSFDAISNARSGYIIAAVVCVVVTYAFAAAVYYSLAFKPLSYRRTLLIQGASGFTNRLLPAGLGALTLYVQYLRKAGHSLPQALAVAGTASLIGGVGHVILFSGSLLIAPDALFGQVHLPNNSLIGIIAASMLAIFLVVLLVFERLRRFLYKLGKDVARNVLRYRHHPRKLLQALGCSCLMTISHVAVFYMSALALGLEISAVQAFIVFTAGVTAATITPTPGGVVGAEAGITAGLIIYGVAAPYALAAALLYRLFTYWLPLIPGFILCITNRRFYLGS